MTAPTGAGSFNSTEPQALVESRDARSVLSWADPMPEDEFPMRSGWIVLIKDVPRPVQGPDGKAVIEADRERVKSSRAGAMKAHSRLGVSMARAPFA